MGRQRTSGFELLVAVLARLSWRVTMIAAVVSWLVLHQLANRPVPLPVGDSGLGNTFFVSLAIMLAGVGQYLLPCTLLIAAAVNFFKSRRDQHNYQQVLERGTSQALLEMSWQEFEQLVCDYFQQKGFDARHVGNQGPDGGVDIELRKGAELSLVQCKQWRATRVGVTVVRELFGVMSARGAVQGYVVSTAEFTPDALQFAAGRNIHLVNGEQLVRYMRRDRGAPRTEPVRSVVKAPDCPLCQLQMVRRVARQGKRQGQSFWGCQRYPGCRGTRDI